MLMIITTWILKIDDKLACQKKSLVEVKKYIDRLEKKDFKRFEIILETRWGNTYTRVTVTSIDENGDFWIIKKNKTREKASRNEILTLNEKNINTIKEIHKLTEQRETTNKEIEKQQAKLEHYKEGEV